MPGEIFQDAHLSKAEKRPDAWELPKKPTGGTCAMAAVKTAWELVVPTMENLIYDGKPQFSAI